MPHPPRRHQVPHHAKKETGLQAQARWCYRQQLWQTPWLRVEIDGDKRHTLLLASGKSVQWESKVNVFGSPLAMSEALAWP
jgi:hypothetical protein